MPCLAHRALAPCLSMAVLCLSGLSACSSSEDRAVEDEHVATLGPEGGILRVRGGTLSIPAGALREAVEITFRVSELGALEVPDRVRVTKSFHLSPHALRLLTAATLSIDYLTERLPGAVHASQFDVRRSDTSQVQERLHGTHVDVARQSVSGEVLQFGVFWGTVPAAPRPATVELSADAQVLSVGQTLQLEAAVLDQSGVAMALEAAGLSFSSSDAAAVSVDGAGLVTALAPGVATITAAAGAARATTRIAVRSDAEIAQNFAWENPLPQGNSLTAVTRDDAGAVYAAAMGGGIWKCPSGGQCVRLHTVPDARFVEMAVAAGRLVAAGAAGSGGILLTIDGAGEAGADGAAKLTARTLAVAGTALRSLSFDGRQGIAVGSGDHLLVFDAALDAWQVETNPSFDGLLAGGFAGKAPRVLTARGLVYERLGQGWTRVNADPPSAALIGAVSQGQGGFAAIDEANCLWRFEDARGWRQVPLSLDLGAGGHSGDARRHLRTGGDGEGEGAPDAGDASDAAAEPGGDAPDAGEGDATEAEDERSDVSIALQAIFRMGERAMLRASETSEEAPARALVLMETGAVDAAAQGGAFMRLELPDPGLTALWASGESDLVAAGTAGAIHLWDGSRWAALSSGEAGWIIALDAFEGGSVYALAERCLDTACQLVENRLLSRTAGGTFADLTLADGFWGRMRALGGRTADDLWVMGEGGLAYRWQGGVWSAVDAPGAAIFAIERCGDELYAVGQGGQVFRERDGAWSPLVRTGTATLRGLGCAGESMFAVGDYQISSWVRGSPVSLTPNDDAIRTALWKAVFVTPEGQAFIGGDARYLLLWNGTNFEYFDNPAGLPVYNVRAFHGTGYTDVWAVGTLTSGEGFLMHFDGADWRSLDPLAVRPLLTVTGAVDGTIWVGGGNGSILRGEIAAVGDLASPVQPGQ